MLKTKAGVQPDALILLCALVNAHGGFEGAPADLVITAGSDGAHKKGSRHYTYQALDIRSKPFAPQDKLLFLQAVIARLGPPVAVTTPTGPGYQTADGQWLGILESRGKPNEHFHLERN